MLCVGFGEAVEQGRSAPAGGFKWPALLLSLGSTSQSPFSHLSPPAGQRPGAKTYTAETYPALVGCTPCQAEQFRHVAQGRGAPDLLESKAPTLHLQPLQPAPLGEERGQACPRVLGRRGVD